MNNKFFKNQRLRESLLSQLKTMSESSIAQLKSELQKEHISLIASQVAAPLNQQKTYDTLILHNERQMKIINDYQHTQYQRLIASETPKKPIIKNTLRAFFVGGLICVIAQLVMNFLTINTTLETKTISGLASVSIIILTAVLTGLGIYDEIGRFGGAGSMVPISGFANSIVSAAMEFKREGMIYGIGAKIFTVAGPVILYGTIASVLIGLIAYLGA